MSWHLSTQQTNPVLTLHMFVLIRNPTDPMVESTEEGSTQEVGEGSKTRYINDSSNLDTITFDAIDTDDNEYIN
jgi:hypothetical protein